MVWKICGNTQFPQRFKRIEQNCEFPQNFYTQKLREVTVLYAVLIKISAWKAEHYNVRKF